MLTVKLKVPLAFSLDDERLIAQAKNYLDYVLDHQAEDGWLGPETTHESRGLWARSLLLFGLTVRGVSPSQDNTPY